MDESEINFIQFEASSPMNNIEQITQKLEKIMNNAKTVLYRDTFIPDRNLCLIDLLRPNSNKMYVHTTFQPCKRTCYDVGKIDIDMCNLFSSFIKEHPNDRSIIAAATMKNSAILYQILKF